MVKLIDALDEVLARVAAGESLASSAARYPDLAAELTTLMQARAQLSVLAPAPAVPVDTLAARRRQLLTTARAYKRQTTSATLLQRFTAWVWPAQRTGQPALLPVLARVAIALVLVLSIVGGTVTAAQSSLPDSSLYGIKLAVEDARLALTREFTQQAALAMSFASERAREMERLAIANRPISDQVSFRLQNELDAALSAAARAPEPEMLRALEEVRTMAQTQERALAQAQLDAPREASTQDALRQAEQAMAQARQQAESGLTDPDAFRNRYGHQQSTPVRPTPEATATAQPPTTLAQPTATPGATVTPQPSHTPLASVTPPGVQAGTGQPPTGAPGPQATGTPQQTGPGPQPTAGQGSPGPQATDTPEGYPGGKPGGGGSDGGTGGNNGGGTRRP